MLLEYETTAYNQNQIVVWDQLLMNASAANNMHKTVQHVHNKYAVTDIKNQLK